MTFTVWLVVRSFLLLLRLRLAVAVAAGVRGAILQDRRRTLWRVGVGVDVYVYVDEWVRSGDCAMGAENELVCCLLRGKLVLGRGKGLGGPMQYWRIRT